METTSVMIQSLCAPCFCRCRYCLLSWDGRVCGAEWSRAVSLAERYMGELREAMPSVSLSFSFGYSMEHPDIQTALRTLRRLGSPEAEFLQCDGMRMRDEKECAELMELLVSEGVKQLNFTVYGLPRYHDAFAGRKGDHALILRMMAAKAAGLSISAGLPLNSENIGETDALLGVLHEAGCDKTRLFIPHREGRGKRLEEIRLSYGELLKLSPSSQALLNRKIFRTEAEWLSEESPVRGEERMILISLRGDNIEEYEAQSAVSAVREVEALDEAYYAAFPAFSELAAFYGDARGDKLFRIRDLYALCRDRYAAEHGVSVYDVTDERYSGSRRS